MDRTDRSELLKASYVSGTGQWSSFGYLLYLLHQYIMSCFLIAKPHAKPHAKLLTESSHDRQASCRVFWVVHPQISGTGMYKSCCVRVL